MVPLLHTLIDQREHIVVPPSKEAALEIVADDEGPLQVPYQGADSPGHHIGTPPLLALDDSFVIARDCAPTAATVATRTFCGTDGGDVDDWLEMYERPDSPHPFSGNVLATPESPPMSHSMVLREAQRIVQCLEELATTPLVDTRQPTLVDFTLDSPELEAARAPCRKLFESPEREAPNDADNSTENWLAFAEEHLRAISLRTSTPQQLSPTAPAFEASFTVDATDAPRDTPAEGGKETGPGALVPGVLVSGAGDAPSSPDLVTRGKALKDFGAWEGATAKVSAVGALQKSSSSATGHLQVSYQGADSPGHHIAPPPLPALDDSFVIARDCAPTAATVATRGLPIAETTFTIPAVPSVKTATRQASATGPHANWLAV
ncbi:uncharacterized protein LOC125945809 [Dermacentor silvarum]|uniref:uncharacterized protein LOC125945809 n=1 Tax=Dermacentor silvarum TaxID=543639 RepID=UPI0021008087|nr:uncharacterized protein LOC125945809 [Dermacentor silvarum]